MTEVWQLEKPRKRRLYVTDTSAPVEVIGQVVHVRKRSPRLVFVDLMMRCDSVSSPLPIPPPCFSYHIRSNGRNTTPRHTRSRHTILRCARTYSTYSSVLSICATVLYQYFAGNADVRNDVIYYQQVPDTQAKTFPHGVELVYASALLCRRCCCLLPHSIPIFRHRHAQTLSKSLLLLPRLRVAARCPAFGVARYIYRVHSEPSTLSYIPCLSFSYLWLA